MLLALLVACPAFQPFDADRDIRPRDSEENAADSDTGDTGDTGDAADQAAAVDAFWDELYALVCARTWECDAEDMSTVSDFPSEAACVEAYEDVEAPACPQFSESAAAACLATYEAWTCAQVREDYLPYACATVCLGS